LIVARLTGLSRAEARQLVESGAARFDGRTGAGRDRLPAGATVTAAVPERSQGLQPEPVSFTVRYDADGIIVVDKPAGIVMHPGAGPRTATLAAGLLYRWPELDGVGGPERAGIVHRLDRGTSGLVLVARDAATHAALQSAVKRREVGRRYAALVEGAFAFPTGTVDAAIGRDPRHPTRMAVTAGGRPAVTHYRQAAAWDAVQRSMLMVRLETGRTHQIRVHLASIRHPVVGDGTYGSGRSGAGDAGRIWLHAHALDFRHPVTDEAVSVESPLPAALADALAALGPPSIGAVPGSVS